MKREGGLTAEELKDRLRKGRAGKRAGTEKRREHSTPAKRPASRGVKS
jgi:hypothetical protein